MASDNWVTCGVCGRSNLVGGTEVHDKGCTRRTPAVEADMERHFREQHWRFIEREHHLLNVGWFVLGFLVALNIALGLLR